MWNDRTLSNGRSSGSNKNIFGLTGLGKLLRRTKLTFNRTWSGFFCLKEDALLKFGSEKSSEGLNSPPGSRNSWLLFTVNITPRLWCWLLWCAQNIARVVYVSVRCSEEWIISTCTSIGKYSLAFDRSFRWLLFPSNQHVHLYFVIEMFLVCKVWILVNLYITDSNMGCFSVQSLIINDVFIN